MGVQLSHLEPNWQVWLQVLNMLSSYKRQVGCVWQVLLESASSMKKLCVEKCQDWCFSKKLFVMNHGEFFFMFNDIVNFFQKFSKQLDIINNM